MSELREKAELLSELLAGYNDGRRKSLFCTAAYLLPPEALREVVLSLRSLQERAAEAASLLQTAADGLGVSLRLVKKPAKG